MNETYRQRYYDLVLLAYGAIASYEKYLLDEINHKELAETMKDMLEKLPPVTLDGKASPPPEKP